MKTSTPSTQSVQGWIDRSHRHYLENGGTQATWEGNYWKIYRKLPLEKPLGAAVMEALIKGKESKTTLKSRTRACMALGALAKFAGIAFDPASLRGNYNHSKTVRRELPEDELIANLTVIWT